MNNEYKILWEDKEKNQKEQKFPANQKANAIEFYLQKVAENAKNLIVTRPDGYKFCPPKKTGKKAYVIEAKFDNYDKIYRYPAKTKPEKKHTNLVVHSPQGIGIPNIISITEVDESALPILCKTQKEHLNWILGSFKKTT